MKWAKWIITGLGWAFMGPIGAILGFVVGSAVDAAGKELNGQGAGTSTYRTRGQYTTPNDIRVSFLLLIAAVMKADGMKKFLHLEKMKKLLIMKPFAHIVNRI